MSICAFVLAAGEGTRLRPLTLTTPKPLLPVGGVPLLDRVLDLLADAGLSGTENVAVNAWHLAHLIEKHAKDRAHVEVEPELLGSSGSVARLRPWIDGRAVLVINGDAYLHGGDLSPLLDGWDGGTVRMLGVPAGEDEPFRFGRHVFAGASLLPWDVVAGLPEGHSHLVHTAWRPAEREGRLEIREFAGSYLDCGTPADYEAANRLASMRSQDL
ncbi:nucleotidyltransferase family protein [Longispora albida]|uniref:nucleotidyltransferase family protein n=1 Tax=Longispora albida TaxID=203523 RepID=UPI000364D202|nr:sugar phosphate nucleotidyltransferase [Longispora albida]